MMTLANHQPSQLISSFEGEHLRQVGSLSILHLLQDIFFPSFCDNPMEILNTNEARGEQRRS